MRLLIFTLFFATLSLSSFASLDKKTVKLRIQGQNGRLCEASVYFDQGIDSNYVFQEDAQFVASGVAGQPIIYSPTADGIPCSINGYGVLMNTEIVSMGVVVDVSGNFNLTAVQVEGFDPNSIIRLEDRQIHRFVDLRTNFYMCHIDSGDAAEGRFFIHVSYPGSFNTTVASCSNNDGELQVTCDPSITWDSYVLYDALNNPLDTFLNVNTPVTFTGLAEGDYYVIRTYGPYTTTEQYHVNGTYITANIGASALQVETYENVTFSALVHNANHYSWDFGDGTLITGVAHPDLAYYEPGVYTVTLICTNDHGCSATADVQIIVTERVASGVKEETAKESTVITQGKNVVVSINAALNPDAQMKVFNLLGQPVYNSAITTGKTIVSLNDQPMGYYLVSVKNNSKVDTKRVFVGQ
jgi:PKD repeat protein